MASLADEIAKQARRRGIGGMLEYYAGPHVSQSARNLGQALQGGLEWLSPAGDIQDLVSSSRDISRGVMSGSPAQALSGALMATAAALGMALPGPSASKIGKALPMDEASRMARAKKQGFHDRPFYHATQGNIDEFSADASKLAEDMGLSEGAIFLTDNPKVADDYLGGSFVRMSSPAAQAHGAADIGGDVGRAYSEGANIMPLRVRDLNPDDFDVWDMHGGAYDRDMVKSAIKDAKKAGKKGVVFTQMRDPGVMSTGRPTPSNVVAVFDPKDVRSRFAAFDPAKKNLANILAGAGGAAVLAPAIASQLPEE